MNTSHDFSPKIFVEVSCILRKLLIVIKARPYRAGIIWCISYKPEVIVCICRTCLACNCHIVQLAGCTCTLCHNIFHCTGQKPCSTFFDNRTSCRCFLDQDIAVVIQDLGIVKRFDIISTVCDRCICSTQFDVCNTIRQTAKCQRKVGICPYSSICITICFCPMCQCCKAKVVQILESQFRCNFLQTFNSNNINRILDRRSNRCGSVVTPCCIINW